MISDLEIGTLIRSVLVLGVVLGLIWSAQWILRRTKATGMLPQSGARLQRLHGITIAPGRVLHLLSCDGRELLILTGGAQDLVVGWVTPGSRGEVPDR